MFDSDKPINNICAVALGAMGAGTAVNYAVQGRAVSAYVRSGKSAAQGLLSIWQDLQNRTRMGFIAAETVEAALDNITVFAGGESENASKTALLQGLADAVAQGTLDAASATRLAGCARIVTPDLQSDRAAEILEDHLDKKVERGFLTPVDAEDALWNAFTAEISGVDLALAFAVCDAEYVTESASEIAAVKQAIFADLSKATPEDALLTSNSSAYPADEWAALVPADERWRCFNVHGFNPPSLMLTCEVAGDEHTSADALRAGVKLLQEIGQRPVVLHKATPGFVANVLQWTVFAATAHLVESGQYGTREEIEKAFQESIGTDWGLRGPFACVVAAGIDTTCGLLDRVAEKLPDVTAVPAMLSNAVAAGQLGVKSGHGMTGAWPPERIAPVRGARMAGLNAHYERDKQRDARVLNGEADVLPAYPVGKPLNEAVEIIVACTLRQAIKMVEDGIATAAVIDTIMQGTVFRRYASLPGLLAPGEPDLTTPPIVSAEYTGGDVLLSIGQTVRPLLDTSTSGLAARLRRLHDGGCLPQPEGDAALLAQLQRGGTAAGVAAAIREDPR